MSKREILPQRGQMLPELSGVSPDGRSVRISDFRGRKNLVLVFSGQWPDQRSHELLRALGRRYRELQDETAEVIAVVAGSPEEAAHVQAEGNLPFPVLADEHGAQHRVFGAVDSKMNPVPAVSIADRYGETYFAQTCPEDKDQCPSAGDILDWLRFIEVQCPECGVSEWPRD